MKLEPQFREFLREIRPTDIQQEDWKSGAKTLRNRLAQDPGLKDILEETFLQGSIRRSTAIRPSGGKRPDVDIVVVTNIDYNQTTPHQAMDRFKPFLDKHYKDKWRPQGRSFGIELSHVDMDLVITALPRTVQVVNERQAASIADRAALANIYRSAAATSFATLEEDTSWRLNPRWQDSRAFSDLDGLNRQLGSVMNEGLKDEVTDLWKNEPLWLPDRDTKTWGRTHPLLQISWTAEKNRNTNKTYLHIVRAIKWWRLEIAEKLPKYPKGYPLEHMVGHLLRDGADLSTAQGIVEVFESFRDKWLLTARSHQVPQLCDHGVPEHNVLARLSTQDFQDFVEVISGFATLARKAFDSLDASESGKLWQQIFGAEFPLPGPNGGDRPAGHFVKPAAAAVPATSDRFA